MKLLGEAALICQQSGSIVGFGQKVGLVNTIKKITHDYPISSMLAELIQNADDAGATEVHIIHDKRRHATDALLGESMKGLQGESLLMYNNTQFTDQDIANITQVASGNKAKDATKTGRFGIGFLSVYHLTDAPSFLSGSKLCFFDPLCQFLPTATAEEPGAQINLSKEFVSNFESQFSPYHIPEINCIPGEPFDGTLFRLPLRTKASDLHSKFLFDVQKLLKEGITNNVLLFLKNIRTLKVSTIDTSESLSILSIYCCYYVTTLIYVDIQYTISKTVTHLCLSPEHNSISEGPEVRLIDFLQHGLLENLDNSSNEIYPLSNPSS